MVNEYDRIRTLGFSAGAYPAIIAGYLLEAEMAFSISGRFHRKKYILKNIDKTITTWKTVHKGHCPQIVFSYSKDNSRDRRYARTISKISGGSKIAIEIKNEKTKHLILQRLLERGELAEFLTRTIFSEINDNVIDNNEGNTIISFPTEKTPY